MTPTDTFIWAPAHVKQEPRWEALTGVVRGNGFTSKKPKKKKSSILCRCPLPLPPYSDWFGPFFHSIPSEEPQSFSPLWQKQEKKKKKKKGVRCEPDLTNWTRSRRIRHLGPFQWTLLSNRKAAQGGTRRKKSDPSVEGGLMGKYLSKRARVGIRLRCWVLSLW